GLVPGSLGAYARAARRAARGADLVHAHWIPSAVPALATGRPYVLQVWGTDVELARRAQPAVRPLLRRARLVIAASSFLAGEADALGARDVRVIPFGVETAPSAREPDDPAHVLFVGRLSEEKGILEFLEATEGLPRVIVGDGPLRARVPEAIGFVPHDRLGEYYERAAVVCVPSRREGYGVVAREAMAYGRPVVATRVGGLVDAIEDGVSGLLVDVNVVELRAVLMSILADEKLRTRLGADGRIRAIGAYGWQRIAGTVAQAYAE